jgi:hypothetical protein
MRWRKLIELQIRRQEDSSNASSVLGAEGSSFKMKLAAITLSPLSSRPEDAPRGTNT